MAWTGAGTGTSGDPWQIYTAADFINAMTDNAAGTYMQLQNDIDMVGQLGYYRCLAFDLKGLLDGNGKTITN